jgi:hypothetical protein
MHEVSSNQVREVQRLSVHARRLSSALLVLLGLSTLLMLFTVLDSPGSSKVKFLVGSFTITSDQVDSVPLKAWLLLIITSALGIAASITYLLRCVFDNMARGEIFSAGNVRHIRNIGFIIVCIGVLKLLVPVVNAMLAANGVIDPGQVVIDPKGIFVPGALLPFAVAGLIYLVSWIMQVGLGVSEEAAELRRDADLVV